MHDCFTTGRKWLLLPASLLAAGCFDVSQTDPHVDGVRIEPEGNGWVVEESLGIRGAWYVYGDRYGDNKCEGAGHPVDACSKISYPDPDESAFPNKHGRMCTSGDTAVVPACLVLPCSDPDGRDFENVWGAGIGLDLNAEQQAPPSANAGEPGSPTTHK
jgi:hypothetical protein